VTPYAANVVRPATVAFALALLTAAPAASAPTHYYRVTGGSMMIETKSELGFERLSWTVAPHAKGTRPAPGFATADGSGGLKTFQVRFPVRGSYVYDYEEDDVGKCTESFALAPASKGTAASRQLGARVRLSWGLDPRRRRGYVPHPCRPKTNNALLYFAANQPTTAITVPSGGIEKKTFSLSAEGTQTGSGTTLRWKLTLRVLRLGHRGR
jgi:hypothetical protein